MNTGTTRTLGRSGIEVSALGIGCWAIGGPTQTGVAWGSEHFGWGNVDDNESIRALHAALAAGVTFFETADIYGAGHSERILGRALAGRRQQVVLATKFGFTFDEYTHRMLGRDASPEYVRRACEGSLSRLQTDYIDLYQLHIGEYDTAYLDDVCDVLEKLVAAGKIRSYGWCTWPDKLEGASIFAQREHSTSIQIQLNVLQDAPEMLKFCEEHNFACINAAPLAMSLLTGKFTQDTQFPQNDVRHNWNFRNGPEAERLKQVTLLREILTSDGRTLTQGALGWIWARSQCTVPIPGFKTVKQVEENAATLQFGPLSQQQMHQISELLDAQATLNPE
jgi:aryl-alcohol dehydrogenase-like predicted oxidoreductase